MTKRIFVHPDHPCYGIDVWEFEDERELDGNTYRLISVTAKNQGYIALEDLVKFWKENHDTNDDA